MTERRATCHCGAVELRVTLSAPLESAARCDCSFCRRRAAPNVSARRENVHVVRGAETLTRYGFGTDTAQHYFCRICGIYMYHVRRSDPSECGVNLGTLEGVNPAEYEPMRWNDGVNHPSDR
ncbi:GFA family protein [Roseivivax sediminis]|uniref:Uncharacterized conserved protein n=1 Tax=Roseivivax sediminis TaxID=936889 RepID=A0A1I2BXK8_9RHOB|nr:GFA family protein [Roseivivax sediminis]SFE60859.1 Uncharacterized conserved protein [Roseivivax sediminis]